MNFYFSYAWIFAVISFSAFFQRVSTGKQCTCGQINDNLDSRIVGGSNTNLHKYPWLSVILKRGHFHCGGSVINNFYILTAAHCIHEGDLKRTITSRELFKVVLGVFDRANNNEGTRLYYDIAQIKAPNVEHTCNMHEIHDIALLKLASEIRYSWAISPICLPKRPEFDYTGKIMTVSGWGTVTFRGKLSRFPREAHLRILTTDACLGSTDVGYHFSENPMAMFCAYKMGSDACKGDSGGPVAIEVNNTMTQIGIVSWGIECALDQHPGVYTKLPYYMFWVHENTLDAEYCET